MLFLLISFPLLSISLESTGYGSTKEEALRNAREELAKSIQVTVSGVSQVRITDTGSVKIESLKEDFSESTNLELLGVKVLIDPSPVINEDKKTTQFQTTVGIDGSQSLHLYITKLEDLYKIIENTDISKVSSLQMKKNIIIHQINSYNQYEAYKYIALQLGATNQNIPLPQRTKIGLQIELNDLLQQEKTILTSKLTTDTDITSNNEDVITAQTQLSQISLQQTQISTDIQEPSIEQLRPELMNVASAIVETASYHPGISVNKSKTLLPAWEELMAAYKSWTQLWNPISALLSEEDSFQETEFQRNKKQIEERPYRTAEIASGEAIELVKARREQEISTQLDAKRKYMEDYELQLIRSYFTSEYIFLYENFIKSLNQFKETRFETSATEGDLQLFFDTYDGVRKAWPMVVRMKIFDENANFEHFLSYSDTTGKVTANALTSDYTDWQSYLDMVDILNSLLTNNPQKIIDAKISYSIVPEFAELNIHQLEILRKDTNSIIYSKTLNSKIKMTFGSFLFSSSELKNAERLYYRFLQDEKERRRIESPQLYSRSGISFHVGFGMTNLDYQDFSRSDLNHSLFAISTADARIASNSVYAGIEFELLYPFYAWIVSDETFHSQYFSGVFPSETLQHGLYGVIGFSKSIETRKGVLLPFLDLRLSPVNSYGGFSGGIGLGIEYRNRSRTGNIQKTSISYYWKAINPISSYGNSYIIFGIGI